MNNKKITKAVIPVAGLGTRFLPWTKNVPKEMLPILNKPTIQYIVEEAAKSGIEDILLVTSEMKDAIVDHFDRDEHLEKVLIQKGKNDTVEELKNISKMARIFTIRQFEPRGLGHAVLQAKSFVGNEPFALLLGDDVMYNHKNQVPVLKQMIDVYEKVGGVVLGVQQVPKDKVSSYGIVEISKKINKDLFELNSIVEKPKTEDAPSNYAISGRYILDPKIFDFLEQKNIDPNTNEIQITDSIFKLKDFMKLYAYEFDARRYDMGSITGFLEANIETAMRDPKLKEFVFDLVEKIKKNNFD